MPPEQQFVSPNQMPLSPTTQPQVPQIGYAGFWMRYLAFNLDSLITSIIITLPLNIVVAVVGASTGFKVVMFLLQIVLIYTYFIYLTNKNQATIGKKLLGLRVVSEGGAPLSLGKIILRETVGKFISMVILFIGYLMVAFTSKKQGLHDKIAGSVVLSNRAERKTWAFVISIIFASILPAVAILGILASVVLASINTAQEKATDAVVRISLVEISSQAKVSYMNNNNYGALLADPIVTTTLQKAATAIHANPTGNISATAYAIYLPLKKPTAPNTGWCVDSTGASRESVDPRMATVCP